MRRDWDCVREILLRVEALGDSRSILYARDVEPFGDETATYHMKLMMEAGLIEAHVVRSTNGLSGGWATGLTWEGHEFLDRIRDQSVWNRVKTTAREKGTSLTFDMIKMIAGAILGAML